MQRGRDGDPLRHLERIADPVEGFAFLPAERDLAIADRFGRIEAWHVPIVGHARQVEPVQQIVAVNHETGRDPENRLLARDRGRAGRARHVTRARTATRRLGGRLGPRRHLDFPGPLPDLRLFRM